MMSTNLFFRSFIAAIFILWLSNGTFAREKTAVTFHFAILDQDGRDKKQEREKEKESKKPEVKEVPQSRRQEKPGEVKPDKKEKNGKEDKKRN